MCENSDSEYYTNVAELKRQIDLKICHLKEELELRKLAINKKVDSFNLGAETDFQIRFDWSDSEIEDRIGSLGSVELEAVECREPDTNSPLSSNKDTLSSNKEPTSSNKDTLSSNKEPTSCNEDTLVSDKETLSSDKDIPSSDKETLSSDKETLSFDEDTLGSDKETLSFDEDTLGSDKETLSSDKETLSFDEDTLGSDKEPTSSDKETLSPDKMEGIGTTSLDSDVYMTMKRQKRNADESTETNKKPNTIATMKIPTNFGTDSSNIEALLSPALRNAPLGNLYAHMKPLDIHPVMKRSASLTSFQQLRAMFEPNPKFHKHNNIRQSENLDTLFDLKQTEESLYNGFEAPCENKVSLAKWRSEEVLSDPIYEVIDENILKKSGMLGSKRNRNCKNVCERTFDLPVIARCSHGKKLGQLDKPKSVAVSPKGLIYVAEKGNNRIQVFNSEAYHLFSFGEKSGSNRMVAPYGLFVRADTVYVTLTNQHAIQAYTAEGAFVRQKGREGREEGRLKLPTGIDGEEVRGKIYVCDTGNNRIQIFDSNLKFIKVVRISKLEKPLAIKVVRFGEFVVLDRSPVCLHFFNTSGQLLGEMIDTRRHLKIINPLYFTISQQGHIIVSDFSNHCIHVFSSDGTLSWILGEAGKGKPLEEPRGIACDNEGRLITVSNKKQDALQIFVI